MKQHKHKLTNVTKKSPFVFLNRWHCCKAIDLKFELRAFKESEYAQRCKNVETGNIVVFRKRRQKTHVWGRGATDAQTS